MTYPYFDLKTFIIYFFFGCLCIFSMHLAKGKKYNKTEGTKGYFLLFITLFIFAVFRKVGVHLGGEDALRYQEGFINYFNHGAERYDNTDVLFGIWNYTIRSFTNNPYLYRGLCYSLIIIGNIYFIKYLCPQKISPIPFICILIPFMRSFGSMRNSMSIALILFSIICFYEKRYFWFILWAISSVLMHRLSFVMLSLFPFIYFARKFIIKTSKTTNVILIGVLICISYLLSTILQKYILLFNLFADNGNADLWYLTNGQGKNILLNWPMYLPHVLLYIAFILKYNKLRTIYNSKIEFVSVLFYFDIIIMPATLVLGLWRFQEYLYISNLILWAYLIPLFYARLRKNSINFLRILFFIGFSGLMLIRLSREWQDLALMPYLFFWQ